MRKKGMTIQFNWIFILIAGVLILSLFVTIIQKQKEGSEKKLDATIKTRLDSILTSAMQSTGSVFKIGMPNAELRFDCEGLRIGASQPAPVGIVFAPDSIKSSTNTIYIMALDWSYPYKITNFLYITPPEVRYVFIKDPGQKAEELYYHEEKQSMPRNVTKELIPNTGELRDYRAKGDYKTRFVFIGDLDLTVFTLHDSFKKIKNSDVTAILIKPDTSLDGKGTIEFYKKDDSNSFEFFGDADYLGRASVIGAIFSDNINNYECNMETALKKMNIVTEIYKKRTKEIEIKLDPANPCINRYSGVSPSFEKILYGSSNSNYGDIHNGAFNDIESVKKTNKVLQLKSCPLIY